MERDPRTTYDISAQPSQEELAILALLAEGLKDDVAARRLGLAKRTYRRRLDSVLGKLGATSRFQAGALAAKRGWIELHEDDD